MTTNFITHAHSGLRWILLILLIYSIINAIIRKETFEKKDRLLYMFTMVTAHIQLVLGLILYFTSQKVQFTKVWMETILYRFYGMEHLVGMILAIALLTVGHIKYKKKRENKSKHKTVLIFYAIALILILLFIPWPFREGLLVNSWF